MNDRTVWKSQISRAIADYARCVIAVLGWPDTGKQFSAVCLSLQDRHFVLTAAHCLDDGDPTQLVIATMKEKCSSRPLRPLRGRSFNWAEIDMAAFELNPSDAAALPVNWVEGHRLTSELIEQAEIVCAAGFPSDLAKVKGPPICQVYPTACILVSKVAAWPTGLPFSRSPAQPQTDFFVEYSPEMFIDIHGRDVWIPDFPQGMSGCPVFWIPPVLEGELWSPAYIRLAGIQSSCFVDRRLLRIQRIEPLAALIHAISN